MWIANQRRIYDTITEYNGTAFLSANSLDDMVENFDSIFDEYTNFTDEISSLFYIPIKALDGIKTTESIGKLRTAKGLTSIDCWNVDYNTPCYFNMDGDSGGYLLDDGGNNGSKGFAAYKGYVTVKCYLPFVGYVDIDPNECLGKVLHFRLVVDYKTGKGMYLICVSDDLIINDTAYANYEDDKDLRIIATYECNIGIPIPLGKSNASDIMRNSIMSTIKVGAGLLTSAYGMSLPPTTITSTSTTDWEVSSRLPYKGSRMRISEKGSETTVGKKTYNKPINKLSPVTDAIAATSDALNRSYPSGQSDRINESSLMFHLSGSIHIVIYRPIFLPSGSSYAHQFGYPYNSTSVLHQLYGYTEISSAHFEGSLFEKMTSNERGMLEQMMADGIILPDPPSTVATSTDDTEEK